MRPGSCGVIGLLGAVAMLAWAGVPAQQPPAREWPKSGIGALLTPADREQIGKPLPPFDLATPSGDRLTSEGLRGRVIVMDFWATWCEPCRKLTAELDKALSGHLDGGGLAMIGVNYRETVVPAKATDPARYWEEQGYKWPMTVNNDEYGDFVLAGSPVVMVVDRQGIVRGKWRAWTPSTAGDIKALVESLLVQK